LHHLEAARDQLSVAERNKAGHRARALELTNEAIDETRAGIDAAEDW
jgi:inosine/xanthosine triphosphate pyrophosphatase family protein